MLVAVSEDREPAPVCEGSRHFAPVRACTPARTADEVLVRKPKVAKPVSEVRRDARVDTEQAGTGRGAGHDLRLRHKDLESADQRQLLAVAEPEGKVGPVDINVGDRHDHACLSGAGGHDDVEV